MKRESPTIEEWRALYDAAIAFRATECWEWTYDSDLFGVQNPQTGEIGYCSVMGNRGMHYALGVYPGVEGLRSYMAVASAEDEDPMLSWNAFGQYALMVSFETKKMLRKEDSAIINTLDLKFRGRHAWPMFRSMRPHRFPWFIERAEAHFLTVALERARDVTLRLRDDPKLFSLGDGLLVQVVKKQNGKRVWVDEVQAVPDVSVPPVKPYVLDEVTLQRVHQMATGRSHGWELDLFYSPASVQPEDPEDNRPYFPFFLLVQDASSGMIVLSQLIMPWDYPKEVPRHLLHTFQETRALPREIHVRREPLYQLLEKVAQRLSIELTMVPDLPMLDQARECLMDAFGG